MRSPIALGVTLFLLFAGIITAFNSFSSINPGEKGVIVTMGQVVGTAEPGVFPKTPFVTNVAVLSTRDEVVNFDGLEAYTKDQQTATVSRVSITYRIDPGAVEDIYVRYGSTENLVSQLITRRVGASLEQVFGQYNAATAVQERTRLGADFSARIKEAVEGTPLLVTAVNIENFSFPLEYEQNINARMAAEVESERAAQTAKTTVINAQAAADAQLATATANAKAVELQGNAEAAAIRAKGDALRENPSLVELTKAERWDGVLPTTMLPNGAVPFIDATPTNFNP